MKGQAACIRPGCRKAAHYRLSLDKLVAGAGVAMRVWNLCAEDASEQMLNVLMVKRRKLTIVNPATQPAPEVRT